MKNSTLPLFRQWRGQIFWCIIFAAALLTPCFGQDVEGEPTRDIKRLTLAKGKSTVIQRDQQVTRAEIEDTKTAAVTAISPNEIYILGKEPGTTYMQLWSDKAVVAVYTIDVVDAPAQPRQSFRDSLPRLKANLKALLPDEHNIRVISSDDSIMLAGKVANAGNLSQALALANLYAPDNVHNLVEVTDNNQVMLEVRVAEMSRRLGRDLGVNFSYARGQDFGVGMLNQLTDLVQLDDAELTNAGGYKFDQGVPVAGPLGFVVSPSVNAMFRFHKGSATWTGFIDALRDDGLVKILAEPNLIALSGQSASFLAGGEFPVPVPQGLGTAAIEWKEYGVRLYFKPVVLGPDKINITVAPEVSELDFSAGFVSGGFIIPALQTRKAMTVIELGDGQSFAIAGLLKNTVRDAISKYPLLGDIPILGQLFSSRSFIRDETELVIIVTPRLVRPMNQKNQPVPTDSYQEPSELDFYLWGNLEGKHNSSHQPVAQLDGQYGHAVPPAEAVK